MPERTCSLPDCGRPLIARDLCSMHYQRLTKTGTTDARPPKPPKPPCSVDDCEKTSATLGWCHMHYRRWRVNGTLDDPTPRPRARCTVEGCDAPGPVVKGFCGRHAYRIKMHGEPGQAERLYREPAAPDATCEIDGCDNGGLLRRGWCTVHYQRWQHHGDPTWEPPTPTEGCSVDGCDREHASLGLCTTHYMRLRRTGTTDDPVPAQPKPCSIDDCDNLSFSLGLCAKHYGRLRKHGSPHVVLVERTPNPPDTCQEDGCGAPHFSRYMCRQHYGRHNHEQNRERRNARMRQHYRDNPVYYAVKQIHRRRLRERLSKAERDLSIAYRMAIANDPCTYCGGPGENTDHVFPLAKGGSDHWWNLVRACEKCNKQKAAHCGTWFRLKRGAWSGPARPVPAVPEADSQHRGVAEPTDFLLVRGGAKWQDYRFADLVFDHGRGGAQLGLVDLVREDASDRGTQPHRAHAGPKPVRTNR